jgi:hypothetical protein
MYGAIYGTQYQLDSAPPRGYLFSSSSLTSGSSPPNGGRCLASPWISRPQPSHWRPAGRLWGPHHGCVRRNARKSPIEYLNYPRTAAWYETTNDNRVRETLTFIRSWIHGLLNSVCSS